MNGKMPTVFKLFVIITFSYCDGASINEQIAHVARRKYESSGFHLNPSGRRLNTYDPRGTILGAPSRPSHLPLAESLLPGNTLIRPVFGMLKSALKYPHKEYENGAGVYGNTFNLGIPWNGRNERLMYSDTRRRDVRKALSTSSETGDQSDAGNEGYAGYRKPDPYLNEFIKYWQQSRSGRRSHHKDKVWEDDANNVAEQFEEIKHVYDKLLKTTKKILEMKKRRAQGISVSKYYNKDISKYINGE